jgi:hypothetical protein
VPHLWPPSVRLMPSCLSQKTQQIPPPARLVFAAPAHLVFAAESNLDNFWILVLVCNLTTVRTSSFFLSFILFLQTQNSPFRLCHICSILNFALNSQCLPLLLIGWIPVSASTHFCFSVLRRMMHIENKLSHIKHKLSHYSD